MADPGSSPFTENTYPTTPVTTGNTTAAGKVGFPEIVFAAVVVGAGIYYVYTIDSRAGWALSLTVVLAIAFGYPSFETELTAILQQIDQTGTTSVGPSLSAGNQTNPQPGSISSLFPSSANGTVNAPTGNTATA